MKHTEILSALGEETIHIELLYLNLKIAKAFQGDEFKKETELPEAEALWREVRDEYYLFLDFLQSRKKMAA